MTFPRAGWRVLVARELRALLRDPVTLALTLLAPALAALITSAGLGSPPKIDEAIGVVGANTSIGNLGGLAALATANGSSRSPLRWVPVDTEAHARQMVASGELVAALSMPETDASKTVTVIVNKHARLVEGLAVSAAKTLAVRLSAGRTVVDVHQVAAPALTVSGIGRRSLSGGELYGPVMAVFFLFLASGFVARGLIAERERGTLARLRTVPIPMHTIIGAKILVMLTVAAAEFATVFVVMRIAFGASWGNVAAVAAVTGAMALAVSAVAIAIASAGRTYQSAGVLVSFVALAFAALGGSLVPLQNLPPVMRRIAAFTPNGIAISAFRDIAANGRGVGDVADALVKIVGFAVVVGGLGAWQLRRTVES